MLLDNCEHLLDDAAEVADQLLRDCPELHILATSREPLELEHERSFHAVLLATKDQSSEFTAAEALFISRVQTTGRLLEDDELQLVSEVCKQLDGLPLALELAAARAVVVPVADLLSGLNSGEFALRRRGGAERQRSLEALVRWSLDLLEPGERNALAALSVFPGRFQPPWAPALLGRIDGLPVDAAERLTRRSLLDVDGDDYRMLESVRAVATAELVDRSRTV